MKYTKEKLQTAVAKSVSVAGVMRELGLARVSGGQASHISNRIKQFGIDTSHFTGQGWSKGRLARNRKSADEILIDRTHQSRYRQSSTQLRRALLESNVDNECVLCGVSRWRGQQLTLEIDHINGNPLDDRKENLRFLCPNCHSQQSDTNKPHKTK